MRKWVIASVALVLATPAFAAHKWFVTVDTVGLCSVFEAPASGKLSMGKTAIGQTSGYDSLDAAKAYLKEVRADTAKCKGVVE
jgi:hypothetical protein